MGIDKIDISKLSGKLQELAKNSDDGNGVIENGEIQIFEGSAKTAVENGQVTEDDYKAIFGSEIKGAAKKTADSTPVATNPGTRTYTKKDQERMEDYVVTILKEEVGTDPTKISEKLASRLGAKVNDPEYKDLQDQVAYILKTVNEIGYNSKDNVGYKSKDNVDSLEKKVKDKLEIKRKDHFAKEVLEALVENAEYIQRAKEYGEIKDAYYKAVSSGMDEEAAYKQVRKEFKDKGSYYKDYLKHGSLAYKMTHLKRKTSEFEKRTIMPEARQTVRDAVYESDATTSKKVKKDAKAKLKSDGDWNRYTKKALGGENTVGEWAGGKDSDMKLARKAHAARNHVEDIKENGLSAEEIHDAVDKRSTLGSKMTFGLFFKKKTQLFEALRTSGLIKEKPDGSYDISALSDLIGEYVGADYTLNRQSAKFKAIAESINTSAGLAQASEAFQNISEQEAKMLVEMCGYKVEKKNWAKTFFGGIAGGILTGASAAIAVGTNPKYKLDSTVTNKNHLEVNLNCTGEVADQLAEQLSEIKGATLNAIEGGIQVIIDQKQVVPLLWEGSRHILDSALKAAVPGMILGMLNDIISDKGLEMPIVPTEIKCEDGLEGYERNLENRVKNKSLSPEYKEVLLTLAKTFVKRDANGENPEWDCEGYEEFLRLAAGRDSVLNRAELVAALEKMKKEVPTETPVQQTPPAPVSVTPAPQPEVPTTLPPIEQTQPGCKVVTKEDINMKDSNKYYWNEIIGMYYSDCLKENGGSHTEKEVRFQLRKVNGIPNNYTSIPANLKLPYDLFGDGSCERTERKDVKLAPKSKGNRKVKVIRTPQGGWLVGTQCPNTNGGYDTSWDPKYYPTKEAAEAAGRESLQ